MAYALIANAAAGSVLGATITTGAVDTSGANLLIAVISDYDAASSTMGDSKSNTWTGLTAIIKTPVGNQNRVQIYYSKNPTVGSGHTFTATAVGVSFPAIAVAAFSGAHLTAPFDLENGFATDQDPSGVSQIQPGSITPTQNNELVITGIADGTTETLSINGGFTITNQVAFDAGNHFGVALAYLIQTAAAAANPTWDWTTNETACATIAGFKVGRQALNTRSNPLGAEIGMGWRMEL